LGCKSGVDGTTTGFGGGLKGFGWESGIDGTATGCGSAKNIMPRVYNNDKEVEQLTDAFNNITCPQQNAKQSRYKR